MRMSRSASEFVERDARVVGEEQHFGGEPWQSGEQVART